MNEFLKTITPIQWFGIIILFNSVLIGGTTQLAHLFIPEAGVQAIGAFCTLVNGFLGGLVTMFGSQGNQVKTVAAMPGVENISVNKQASAALATIAMSNDADSAKVEATPSAATTVAATAKAAS